MDRFLSAVQKGTLLIRRVYNFGTYGKECTNSPKGGLQYRQSPRPGRTVADRVTLIDPVQILSRSMLNKM